MVLRKVPGRTLTNKKPLVKNAANENEVRAAASKQERLREQELNDLRFVLNDARGRRFLIRFMEYCGMDTVTKINESFFNGRRSIGIKLKEDIQEASFDAYLQLLKEERILSHGDSDK